MTDTVPAFAGSTAICALAGEAGPISRPRVGAARILTPAELV